MSDESEKREWSVEVIKEMLRRQIDKLESTVNPMLRGGANPDDNEELRANMIELEALRKMLAASEGDDE